MTDDLLERLSDIRRRCFTTLAAQDMQTIRHAMDRIREANAPLSEPRGCVCPPGANKECEAPLCPRKNYFQKIGV